MKSFRRIFGGILIIILCISWVVLVENSEIKTIRSEKQLHDFYEQNEYASMSLFKRALLLPFSIFYDDDAYRPIGGAKYWAEEDYDAVNTIETTKGTDSTTKDYSKTNIQVEGVDEADIIKTDGDYIYSISENKVVITNVKNSKKIKIESTITNGSSIPMDLIVYKDTLVVISSNEVKSYYEQNTLVSIYDIRTKSKPKLEKSFELKEPYYTTRCIDGQLYVFSKGYLRESNKKIERTYIEDSKTKEISLNQIKYIKDDPSVIQTLIAEVNLNAPRDVRVNSFLMDISNAYVSKNNIYLLNDDYDTDRVKISSLFSWKGVIGFFESLDYNYEPKTKIYKFEMHKSKGVVLKNTAKVDGSIVNQYSLDEKDDYLRIALETNEGTRIAILDYRLKLVGETEKVASGERMYASRFMGNKAYLVTYKNTDPLFVVDLSNNKKPKVMGELKIPGYSTYLHPYDETHLIGIGMDTEEEIIRDDDGRVINNWTTITGMKMCLFDVSDINNPKEVAKTTIGDRRTVSAVLTNPKALLFSKKKNLLAIPVNNYDEDVYIESSDTYEEEEYSYYNYNKPYVAEGYFVYNINLKDGFNLKGIINHEKIKTRYSYYSNSRLLRGLYIDNNLYTVSEGYIKVNDLKDLKEINSLNISKGVDENGK